MTQIWFHGTNEMSAKDICLFGIDFSKSNPSLDFGKGFYLTDDKYIAKKRAISKTNMFNRIHKCVDNPAIVSVKINQEFFSNLRVKEFPYCNEEWMKFTIANRLTKEYLVSMKIQEHNLDLRYDVVIGSIADSGVSQIANDIITSNIDFKDISVYDVLTSDGRTLGEQMSLHTNMSLNLITDIAYELIESPAV